MWEGNSASVSPGPLLDGLFEHICLRDSQRATRCWGKETGETAHVERWNNTLRQRLARFVRMALSFSTSEVMHEACLLLFLHRYNLNQAILLT